MLEFFIGYHDFFETLAAVVTALSFPLALYLYYIDNKRERQEKEYGTYDALDQKYIEFLQLCLQYPETDLFDAPLETPIDLSPSQKVQQQILFLILISILERSFLMYKDHSSKVRQEQWFGWDYYFRTYTPRENFRRLWKEPELHTDQFEEKFVAYFNSLIEQFENGTLVIPGQNLPPSSKPPKISQTDSNRPPNQ